MTTGLNLNNIETRLRDLVDIETKIKNQDISYEQLTEAYPKKQDHNIDPSVAKLEKSYWKKIYSLWLNQKIDDVVNGIDLYANENNVSKEKATATLSGVISDELKSLSKFTKFQDISFNNEDERLKKLELSLEKSIQSCSKLESSKMHLASFAELVSIAERFNAEEDDYSALNDLNKLPQETQNAIFSDFLEKMTPGVEISLQQFWDTESYGMMRPSAALAIYTYLIMHIITDLSQGNIEEGLKNYEQLPNKVRQELFGEQQSQFAHLENDKRIKLLANTFFPDTVRI